MAIRRWAWGVWVMVGCSATAPGETESATDGIASATATSPEGSSSATGTTTTTTTTSGSDAGTDTAGSSTAVATESSSNTATTSASSDTATAETGGSTTGSEDCGVLEATIRDVSTTHPDFQTFTGSMAYTGLVLDALGSDGTPAYNPGYSGTPMITSAASFADWYHDMPGTNEAFAIVLPLTDEGTGEFIFDSAAFFPIDDEGFGNEGNTHNFHFTTEVHTSFTYGGGEVFTFRGDDDVWVFVDGQLALDLGGLHSVLEATIAMDSLGLMPGQTYPMDIFHAERHTSQSNFRIVTTIDCFVPVPS